MLRPFARLSVLAAVIGFTCASSHAALVITEVMSSSGNNGTADWFELTNTGASAEDITGYKMDDNSFAFANSVALAGVTSIPAGGSAVFIESTDVPADEVAAFKTFWGGTTATASVGYYVGTQAGVSLGSGGDGVVLYTGAGTEVTRVNFGNASSGASFDGFGTDNHIATVGVRSAFNSVSTSPQNVGSPGLFVATPEPTTLAALSFISVFARRRRA